MCHEPGNCLLKLIIKGMNACGSGNVYSAHRHLIIQELSSFKQEVFHSEEPMAATQFSEINGTIGGTTLYSGYLKSIKWNVIARHQLQWSYLQAIPTCIPRQCCMSDSCITRFCT